MPLTGVEWNQATLESNHLLNNGLVMILAFDEKRECYPIGTGFVCGAFGNTAHVFTAAHNVKEILRLQSRPPKSHPTALAMFLPEPLPIDIGRLSVRLVCVESGKIEMAIIENAVYDENIDIALLTLRTQNPEDLFFKSALLLNDQMPNVGDKIAVLGYANMKVTDQSLGNDGQEFFALERQLLLRAGTVTDTHHEGLMLCRGPCVTTSVPVFGGMSGGPVFKMPNDGEPIMPFGVVCTDPEEGDKFDLKTTGRLVVAMLPINILRGSHAPQTVNSGIT